MMHKTLRSILLSLTVALSVSSCVTRKEISYFQTVGDSAAVQVLGSTYEITIQPGDLISIHVTSLSKEASSFFNAFDETSVTSPLNSYLVNTDGSVDIPLVGMVKVSGMTTQQAKTEVTSKLLKYLVEPTVQVRLRNFKITLLGEVKRPGVYPIDNAKVTLVEALGLAGDLSIYGKRTNILVIREENGERKFARLDITRPDLFTSEFYYLRNNDVIYVEPGKALIASADEIYRILPIVLSGLTTIGVFLRVGGTY